MEIQFIQLNYIQDPDEVIDFRGPDFHEPIPNRLAYLKEVNTLSCNPFIVLISQIGLLVVILNNILTILFIKQNFGK